MEGGEETDEGHERGELVQNEEGCYVAYRSGREWGGEAVEEAWY